MFCIPPLPPSRGLPSGCFRRPEPGGELLLFLPTQQSHHALGLPLLSEFLKGMGQGWLVSPFQLGPLWGHLALLCSLGRCC